jgi:hypothetical protein
MILALLALDSFKPTNIDIQLINITEGNIAVIPCELPNANPRAIPIFYFDHHRIEIEPKSSKTKTIERLVHLRISRSVQGLAQWQSAHHRCETIGRGSLSMLSNESSHRPDREQ